MRLLTLFVTICFAGCGEHDHAEPHEATGEHAHHAGTPEPAEHAHAGAQEPAEHAHHAAAPEPAEHAHHAGSQEPGEHAQHTGADEPLPPGVNPVQAEMRALTDALQATVRGIGAGDVRAVEHDLHRVHAARERTDAALAAGTYRPPVHPERLDRFRELDAAFHADLERLAGASHRNDVPAAADAFGAVMRGCPRCHAEHRDP
ncbi:MAG: cytochrome c [Sandaracinaceae bacterium]|nr:cytochrome c [Sandaracinaceae bacterium]